MAHRSTTVRMVLYGGNAIPVETHKRGIVIADDHPIYSAGLRSTLECDPDYTVVGEAADVLEGLVLVRDRKPDVLLLGLTLLEHSGFDVLVEFAQRHATVKTILLAEQIDRAREMESLRFGVRGIVLKGTSADLLRKSIRTVATGGYWLHRHIVRDLAEALAQREAGQAGITSTRLTPRELEIVALVAKGYTNRHIARHCSITEHTVKRHVTNVFDKTGRSSRLELTLLATSNHEWFQNA